MERKIREEIRDLIEKIENFKKIFSELNEKSSGFSIVNQHINKSITESEEATKKIIENITYSLSLIEENLSFLNGHVYSMEIERIKENENQISANLTEALTLLEFQDILAQRLKKISSFLSEVEKDIVKIALELGLTQTKDSKEAEKIKKKLEELEWKKEVSQTDVDEILNEFGM
jgi:chemotaxis protein CheZ